MNTTVAIVIGATLSSVSATLATGADAAPTARVRVFAPVVSKEPIVGVLVAADGEALTVIRPAKRSRFGWPFRGSDAEMITLPRESVTRLDRSVRPSRKQLGAGIGLLVGVAVGVAVVHKASSEDEEDGCSQCGIIVAAVSLPFALVGGAVAPGERWATEDPKNLQVGFSRPRGGGVGVRLAIAF